MKFLNIHSLEGIGFEILTQGSLSSWPWIMILARIPKDVMSKDLFAKGARTDGKH
jgi:hypothetical protein